jgi:hypothetical protein
LAPVRLRLELWTGRIPPYLRDAEKLRLVGPSLYPARRPPDVAQHAAGLRLGGNESYPDLFQPYGGFPDGVEVQGGYVTMPELPGIGFEGKSDLYRELKALSS